MAHKDHTLPALSSHHAGGRPGILGCCHRTVCLEDPFGRDAKADSEASRRGRSRRGVIRIAAGTDHVRCPASVVQVNCMVGSARQV